MCTCILHSFTCVPVHCVLYSQHLAELKFKNLQVYIRVNERAYVRKVEGPRGLHAESAISMLALQVLGIDGTRVRNV